MSSQFLRHPLGSVCNSRLASWAMNLNHGKNSYKALGMSMIIHNHLGRISLIWQPQWGISHLSLSYIVPIARSPDCPSVVGGGGCALAYEMMMVEVAAAVGGKGGEERRKIPQAADCTLPLPPHTPCAAQLSTFCCAGWATCAGGGASQRWARSGMILSSLVPLLT